MSQALSTIPSISSLITRSSSSSKFTRNNKTSPCLNIQMSITSQFESPPTNTISPLPRRNIIGVGIASAILLLGLNDDAWAAARRPPPPPPEEKKDPNVTGVKAKILASKKRKEAMKQAMAKQREKGKSVDETSKSSIDETSNPQITEETSDSSSSPSQP